MSSTTWTIQGDKDQHTIVLDHARLGGTWVLRVDGQDVTEVRSLSGRGWRGHALVDGRDLDVAGVRAGGRRMAYFLLADGDPVPSTAQSAAGVTGADLRRDPGMGHLVYWEELAHKSGLDYSTDRSAHFWYRHRLMGRLEDRLISAHLEQPFGSKVFVSFKAHVPSLADLPDIKRRILEDERLPEILGTKHNMAQLVGVAPTHIGVFVPYEPQFEAPEDLARRLQAFAKLVAAYSKPLPLSWCAECEQSRPVLQGFMNRFPVQMCESCIAERRTWGESMQANASTITRRTVLALLAGLVVSLWGGMLWALLTVSFEARSVWPLLMTVVAPLSLAIAVRLTYTLARQPSAWFWASTTAFVVTGVLLAQVVATTWRETWVARGFLADSLDNLSLFMIFALILSLWYGWRGWRNQRRHLASMLVPEIEVVTSPQN